MLIKKEKNNEIILSVTYPMDKMDALRLYIKGEGDEIEQELIKTIDRLYGRYVPPSVKLYLQVQEAARKEAEGLKNK